MADVSTWTYSVTRDEGRGSFFWCVWPEIVRPYRTRKTPSAHGWEATEDAAVDAARRAVPAGAFAIRNAHVAESILGWKRFAAPGFTRDEVRARREAEDRKRWEAFNADFERRFNEAKAKGPYAEAEFWESLRREREFKERFFYGFDRHGDGAAGKPALDVLGLPKGSTVDDVKRAYRKLARVHHPDRGGDATKFREVTNAYKAALAVLGAP